MGILTGSERPPAGTSWRKNKGNVPVMSHFIIELSDFLVMKRLDLIITNMDLGNLGSTQNPIITFQYISYGCV